MKRMRLIFWILASVVLMKSCASTGFLMAKPKVTLFGKSYSDSLNYGLVRIYGGTFDMGDVMNDHIRDEPVHRVTISDFYIGRTEVTFVEYDRFCDATKRSKPHDEGWGRGSRPVINVNWYDAAEYCNWLSEQGNLTLVYSIDKISDSLNWKVTANWEANGFRLPTESEWEYAAREGGKKVRFGNGKDLMGTQEGDQKVVHFPDRFSMVEEEDRIQTSPVGSLNSSNILGLHDMSENVWEWCWDWYDDYPTKEQINPKGANWGDKRVLRGGGWKEKPEDRRVAKRGAWYPKGSYNYCGFRLARSVDFPSNIETKSGIEK